MATVLQLAHEGGWDEILLVAAPLAVFAALLLVARRRALAEGDSQRPEQPDSKP